VAERTAQLSQKTNDINGMLQNMSLGVSTVIPGNLIHPEYSNHLRTIFSFEDVGGKDLMDSLFKNSSLGADTKDQIAVALGAILGEEAMMFALNGHLLVGEMRLDAEDGTHKVVKMDWSPIVGEGGQVDKVLLITQDVTHLRELEASSAQQKDDLAIIAKIIKISIGKFNAFLESSAALIAANQTLLQDGGRDAETVAALFRNMHTLKGNARMFEFTHITDIAHGAEQTYDRLRKDADATWHPADMLAELDLVEAAVQRYIDINEDTLGRKGRASDLLTTRGVFVANEQLAALRSMAVAVSGSHPGGDTAQLQLTIEKLGLIDLARLVSGSVDSLSSLAKELGKPSPSVEIVNGEMAFNSQFAEAFKSACMHIHRNSLDHGIESPADRRLSNKPEQGTVHFACERRGDLVELRIGDDGRGLALHKLFQQGVAGGLFSAHERPTRSAVADVIFRSGLTTSERLTQVSGRGVGMDAVRVFLKEQGATISLALDDPSGTELDFAPFEFVISVPPSAYRN
jgi:HPt (histidine-containing phosphotransfer) domain-containing protein